MKQSPVLRQHDPEVAAWEPPYRGDIHALAILADQDDTRLEHSLTALCASVEPVGDILVIERGEKLTRQDPATGELEIEHFGFADGVSQPRVIVQDRASEIAVRGADHWDPAAPLGLLLAEEYANSGTYGSYFVYRKLEQHVRDFLAAEQQLADALGLRGDDREFAGTMAVGRFRNGNPIIPTRNEPSGAPGNDFNFDQDRFGAICPYHAHIRKTNPRGDLTSPSGLRPSLSLELERSFRIARRGMTYGDRPDLAPHAEANTPPPNTGVGLLFMCAQGRLRNFEIQQDGSDSNDFVNPGVGADAVIGQNRAPVPQKWTRPLSADGPGGDAVMNGELRFTMANFVTFLGGEYFFVPSLPWLRHLDRGETLTGD